MKQIEKLTQHLTYAIFDLSHLEADLRATNGRHGLTHADRKAIRKVCKEVFKLTSRFY